jgi:hypothetical protein
MPTLPPLDPGQSVLFSGRDLFGGIKPKSEIRALNYSRIEKWGWVLQDLFSGPDTRNGFFALPMCRV